MENITTYTIYIETALPFNRMKTLEKRIKRFLKETGLDFRTDFGNSQDTGRYNAFIRVEEQAPEGEHMVKWLISGESVIHKTVISFFEGDEGVVNCEDNCVQFAASQIIDHNSTEFFSRSQTTRYKRHNDTRELRQERTVINDTSVRWCSTAVPALLSRISSGVAGDA